MDKLDDVRVLEAKPIISPRLLKAAEPLDQAAADTVILGRTTIERIIDQNDPRFLAIVGPCSIHDIEAACHYGALLKKLAVEVADKILLVMRVYFEKPRTTVGWKGLISDPFLHGTENIQEGLKMARHLLLKINRLGLGAATEFLDPTVPQFIADLVSWAAIGARTTESQTHREMASGLSMPVGFKNGTGGTVQIAINAIASARSAHSFLGINQDGLQCQMRTSGNPYGHLVLRGGKNGPNYDAQNIKSAGEGMRQASLRPAIIVDASHDNSGKQHQEQARGWKNIVSQRAAGNRCIIGGMLESNLVAGKQDIKPGQTLQYGQSITDACIGWEETAELIKWAHRTL